MGQVLESDTHVGPARLADSWTCAWPLYSDVGHYTLPSQNGLPVAGDHATIFSGFTASMDPFSRISQWWDDHMLQICDILVLVLAPILLVVVPPWIEPGTDGWHRFDETWTCTDQKDWLGRRCLEVDGQWKYMVDINMGMGQNPGT